MKVDNLPQKFVSQYSITNNSNKSDSIHFSGSFSPAKILRIPQSKMYKNFNYNMQRYFNISSKEADYAKNIYTSGNQIKHDLMYILGRKYRNLYFTNQSKELGTNFKNVADMVSNISKPSIVHKKLAKQDNLSFGELENLFVAMDKNKDKTDLVLKLLNLNEKIINTKKLSYNFLSGFVNSKYASEINKNFADYKPYLYLNINKKNIVSDLEQAIENKSYQPQKYEQLFDIINLKNQDEKFSDLSEEVLMSDYYPEKMEVISHFGKSLRFLVSYDKKALNETLLKILKSSNRDNYKDRIYFFDNYLSKNYMSFAENSENIKVVPDILHKIENNENDKEFVYNVIEKNIPFKSPVSLYEFIANIDTKVVNKKINSLKNLFKAYRNNLIGNYNEIELAKDLIDGKPYINRVMQEATLNDLRSDTRTLTGFIKYKLVKFKINLENKFFNNNN